MAKDKQVAKTSAVSVRKAKKRRSIVMFFREVVAELKKVSWPESKDLFSAVAAVVVFVVIVGVIVSVLDLAFSEGIKLIS